MLVLQSHIKQKKQDTRGHISNVCLGNYLQDPTMRLFPFLIQLAFVVVAWAFFCDQPAHAYLDPSTGAFIFHCISAAILGTLITLRLWWSRVLSFFKAKPKS